LRPGRIATHEDRRRDDNGEPPATIADAGMNTVRDSSGNIAPMAVMPASAKAGAA